MSRAGCTRPVAYTPAVDLRTQLHRALRPHVPAAALELAVTEALSVAVEVAEARYRSGWTAGATKARGERGR